MADPNPQDLDALDRLMAAGRPSPSTPSSAGAPAGPDVAGLARVAFAVQAAAADAEGLDADRASGTASPPAEAPAPQPRPRLLPRLSLD